MATTPNDLTRQQLDDLDALLQRMLSVPIAEKEKPAAAPAPATPTMTARLDPPTPASRTPHIAPAMMPEATVSPSPSPMIFESRIDARNYVRPDSMPTPAPIGPTNYDPPAYATPSAYSPTTRLFGVDEPMPSVVEQRTASVTVEPIVANLDPEPNITVEPPAMTFQQAMNLPQADLQDSAIPLTVAEAPLPDLPLFAPANEVPIVAWPLYGANRVIEGGLHLFGPPGELLTTGPVKWLLGLTGLGLLAVAAAWTARGMGWVSW
jgi:hypothetical protein